MKIVQINTTCGMGSTGKICLEISKLLNVHDIENYILYTTGESDYFRGIKYASNIYKKAQALKSRVFGNNGFNSKLATKELIKNLERIQPDIIHIHNIHGHDCNLSMLFNYIKAKKIKVFYTFHDCWSFTASCPHFVMAKCEKWKSECKKCPQIRKTSWFIDRTNMLFKKKKELFEGLDLTIITPSQWLADLVKDSFFKEYPVVVIYNGIDLNIFKPIPSNFRKKYNIEEKKILLGVAFDWGERKGLDVFIELSKKLDDSYQIVLVGTNNEVDKKLPSNIISIHRTQNQEELAEIYTAVDLFVNPTREEVLGLVNIESLACGTPVVTFNSGGSPECIDITCGMSVLCDDIETLEDEIIRICNEKPYSKQACIDRAKMFDKNARFDEYIQLYMRE